MILRMKFVIIHVVHELYDASNVIIFVCVFDIVR